MRLRISLATLTGLLLAVLAGAQGQMPTHLIPVVMHGPGVAPSFWQSGFPPTGTKLCGQALTT